MKPRETIERFDRFLAARGLELDAVVVGGAALGLLGVVSRQTRDCDVLHPDLPEPVKVAAGDFAAEERRQGRDLQDDWLNNGPASLSDVLPDGWRDRLQTAFEGEAIRLKTLGRGDLLKAKLFALCDRATDLPDCVALEPSAEELDGARAWLHEQDGNPDWPAHVDSVLADLARRLGHGV